MDYPRQFSSQASARIEAERLRGIRELEAAYTKRPPDGLTTFQLDQQSFHAYILRVFLAFVQEACALGKAGVWAVGYIRTRANEFLRNFVIEAYYEKGRSRGDNAFPAMTDHFSGELLDEVDRKLRDSGQWRQYETLLLEVAESQAREQHKPEPPKPAETKALPTEPAPTSTKRLPSTIVSPSAARRVEDYIAESDMGQTEFASLAKVDERTLRRFRKSGRIRKGLLSGIAEAMGTTREELLKPYHRTIRGQ